MSRANGMNSWARVIGGGLFLGAPTALFVAIGFDASLSGWDYAATVIGLGFAPLWLFVILGLFASGLLSWDRLLPAWMTREWPEKKP